jgi:DNA modification methylase
MIELNKIYQGDCLEVLKTFPDNFIQTCVTSPPYFGLRSYATAKWEGGDPNCDHIDERAKYDRERNRKGLANNANEQDGGERTAKIQNGIDKAFQYKDTCLKCGAERIDQQIGLEETPKEYVEKLVEVFREVKRVLRDDGTLWLNLGDSYNGSNIKGLKPKDLIGIPWRVAFALQEDGWYLRQDIIFSKPNPMPESVLDRCTKSHEYIFMLTKFPRYFYDNAAIKEPCIGIPHAPGNKNLTQPKEKGFRDPAYEPDRVWASDGKRNRRSVWTITPKPYKGAHFATFPFDLPELCIKAGTSEKGCCPDCGKPWERVLEKEYVERPNGDELDVFNHERGIAPAKGQARNRWSGGDIPLQKVTAEDWQCDCQHNQKPIPCIVLDPFMGAGTTAVACVQLKRNYIGIELSSEYCQIAEQRIADYKDGVTNFVFDLFGEVED